MKEYNLASTFVKGYNVSTAYRQSSASLAPDERYFETLVRQRDKASNTRNDLVYQASDCPHTEENAIASHNSIVADIANGIRLSERDRQED